MKTLTFETEQEFRDELDGKIYSIANADNTKVLCNVLEEDLRFLVDAYEVVCVYDFPKHFKGNACDYAVRDDNKTYETLKLAVNIEILQNNLVN